MPKGVDHTKWKKARTLAAEQNKDRNWKYVMGIYKKLEKAAEMKKTIDGILKVKAIEPTQSCKKHKELNDMRNELFTRAEKKAAHVTLGVENKPVEMLVEIADGPLAEMQGLAGRDTIEADCGMLFKRAEAFWMKGVNFDLDIIFTDKAGSIKDIQTMAKLNDGDYPVIYRPSDKSASVAIEMPSGWCKSNNITVGDRVVAYGKDQYE